MTYQVVITTVAKDQLVAIADLRVREKIRDRIRDLAANPVQQGKALRGALAGYRSVRAVGQRYRVIYQVHEAKITVYVIEIGLLRRGDRADVYTQAEQNTLRRHPPRRKE